MKTKLPPTKRKFAHNWEEIRYLHGKLLYWFYDRQLPTRARLYAKRLKRLLDHADRDQESILGQECRALISEVTSDLRAAIAFREREINQIRKLHEITAHDQQASAARVDYGPDALSDRLDLLAGLYDQIGDTARAIRILLDSRDYCLRHRIPFDAQEMLDELTECSGLSAINGRERRHKSA